MTEEYIFLFCIYENGMCDSPRMSHILNSVCSGLILFIIKFWPFIPQPSPELYNYSEMY